MLRIVLFSIFAPLAMIELLFYKQFGVLLVGGLYFGLAMQADWAAGRLLKNGDVDANGKPRKRRHWSEDEPVENEELHVNPLGGSRTVEPDTAYAPPPPPREAPALSIAPPPAAAFEVQPARRARDTRPAELRKLPSIPNFRGQAHEVLGVSENARTRTIVNAFRHWIKRFHPDRAQDLAPELANRRVQRLTEAKELLLERRRSRKAA
jgi:hypothetical protein